jgi:hypothetical protein
MPMQQGTGGVGMEGQVGHIAKTPSLRGKERETLAKCSSMPAGAQKEGCLKDYRTRVGNITQLPSGEWSGLPELASRSR